MQVIKGEELAELYDQWAVEDSIFYRAAAHVRGEVEMSEAQKEFIELCEGLEQKEVGEIVGLDYRRVQVLLNRITDYDFEPLNQKLRQWKEEAYS